ncbi:hypothetical protein QQ73_09690, partial [Candidatus Endoriftia persephone str. Guaymas]|nr:hypothetical protein [Candidatus Endoriftia persephone str. Guaymas]
NLSLRDVEGGLLLVPQFTLAADTRKGMRAGFSSSPANRSVASTSAWRVPGSVAECPASATTCSSLPGQARCSSQAELSG